MPKLALGTHAGYRHNAHKPTRWCWTTPVFSGVGFLMNEANDLIRADWDISYIETFCLKISSVTETKHGTIELSCSEHPQ